jgi:hypothetical protein
MDIADCDVAAGVDLLKILDGLEDNYPLNPGAGRSLRGIIDRGDWIGIPIVTVRPD